MYAVHVKEKGASDVPLYGLFFNLKIFLLQLLILFVISIVFYLFIMLTALSLCINTQNKRFVE